MKTSLRRLRGALHRHDVKGRRDHRPFAQKDDLAQASQDMGDMKDCYDSLLSAAAATANSAYEFSESLRELGACLLEKTSLNDDEESGRVLLMLGKSQFELQKFVDNYRSHIFQTITIPSESLLNELQTVEEMKRQCEEKRNVYEYMLMRQREKGKSKGGKGESFSTQQLQEAHDEYDQESTLFVFRMKSLKQGQTRSLLTQAARHHAAQLCFFKKALKSLEDVEPCVKEVTAKQHIDYHFSGLEDDADYGIDNNDGDESEGRDDSELSFGHRENDQDQDIASTAQNFPQLNHSDITFPQVARLDDAKENQETTYRKSVSFKKDFRSLTQSAPLFFENQPRPSEKLLHMRSSTSRRKSISYVLPTPLETKSPQSPESVNVASQTPKTSLSSVSHARNLWHSSPLEQKTNHKASSAVSMKAQSVLRESNKIIPVSSQLPPPLSDGLLRHRPGEIASSDNKKMKRQSFSGPLTSLQWPNKPVLAAPLLYSGPILENQFTKMPLSPPKVNSSPRISPGASPTFGSSPKISELHELPRPPKSSIYKSPRALGFSAPLVSKEHLLATGNKPVFPNSASPLPRPPMVIRSFSIPSSSHKVASLDVSETCGDSGGSALVEHAVSPPVTQLSKIHNSSVDPKSDQVDQSGAD